MSKKLLVDLEVKVHHKTALAVLVSIDGERKTAVWVPFSQCELYENHNKGWSILTLPENIATEKGLT